MNKEMSAISDEFSQLSERADRIILAAAREILQDPKLNVFISGMGVHGWTLKSTMDIEVHSHDPHTWKGLSATTKRRLAKFSDIYGGWYFPLFGYPPTVRFTVDGPEVTDW